MEGGGGRSGGGEAIRSRSDSARPLPAGWLPQAPRADAVAGRVASALKARMVAIRARRAGEARALRTWAPRSPRRRARRRRRSAGRWATRCACVRRAAGGRGWSSGARGAPALEALPRLGGGDARRRNDEARALGTWRATCVEMNERLLLVRRAVARIARRRELAAFGQWLRRVRQRYQRPTSQRRRWPASCDGSSSARSGGGGGARRVGGGAIAPPARAAADDASLPGARVCGALRRRRRAAQPPRPLGPPAGVRDALRTPAAADAAR